MASPFTYDAWMEAQGIPVHKGYYVEDLRTVELGPWTLRGCEAAFLQLEGMQGVVEARVSEVGPGQTLPAFKLGIDEVVYVLSGQGSTAVWGTQNQRRHTFEWSPRSMYMVPRNAWSQISNMHGDRTVRLLHYNYMPLALSASPDPDFFFNNPYEEELTMKSADFYSEAQSTVNEDIAEGAARRTLWLGNFFPDMAVWDKLMDRPGRGSINRSVYMQSPGTEISMHMSVFPAGTYKKGHRHGPGRVIVIPGGEGYSIMWPEGGEQVVIPWHEASCFVPPDRWFHQHFNLGNRRAATSRCTRRTSSRAYPSALKTSAGTRSNTPTRTPGSGSCSRPSSPSAASAPRCRKAPTRTSTTSGATRPWPAADLRESLLPGKRRQDGGRGG